MGWRKGDYFSRDVISFLPCAFAKPSTPWIKLTNAIKTPACRNGGDLSGFQGSIQNVQRIDTNDRSNHGGDNALLKSFASASVMARVETMSSSSDTGWVLSSSDIVAPI